MSSRSALLVVAAVVALCGEAGVQAAQLVDPTRPVAYRTRDADQLRLESVLLGADRRIAMISGKAVKVGERVEGALVTAITRNRVVLRRNNTEIVLVLADPMVKTVTEKTQ